MTRVIAVTSRKGGAGKSTVSMLLATSFAVSKKKKVLLVDCDNQKTAWETRQLETTAVENSETPISPPYEIEAIPPTYLQPLLQAKANNYDIIFIDMPRITDDSENSAAVQTLTFCDSVLVPILPGRADAMSAKKFIEILGKIAEYKKQHDFPFQYYGFMNKASRYRKGENETNYMEQLGLPMFDHVLNDLKIFLSPSTYDCFLQESRKKGRYQPFFNEFKKSFKL